MTRTRKEKRPGRLSPEDEALWYYVTGSVKPMPGRKRIRPKAPKAICSEEEAPEPPVYRPIIIPEAEPVRRPTEELNHGDSPGVDRRSAQRLRRGQMAIEARLDLHGHSQEQAHRALAAFISASQAAGRRCVLVITGKGLRPGAFEGGVLRAAVPRWLNLSPLREKVLSFSYAQPRDGGEGALYILLRRNR